MARKLSALRHLYKYLLLDRYITADPTLNIDTPRQWKVLPKSLASDEVESVLKGRSAAKDDSLSQALSARDRAMLEVFYAGALRVSEVVHLKLEDLKLELGYVLVHGKGDKERIVPLGRAAQDIVQEYLRIASDGPGSREVVAISLHRPRSAWNHSATRVADGERGVSAVSSCQPAHAAPQLRDAHGGERSRFAHGTNDSRPRGYFDDPGLYTSGIGSTEQGVQGASSAGEGNALTQEKADPSSTMTVSS